MRDHFDTYTPNKKIVLEKIFTEDRDLNHTYSTLCNVKWVQIRSDHVYYLPTERSLDGLLHLGQIGKQLRQIAISKVYSFCDLGDINVEKIENYQNVLFPIAKFPKNLPRCNWNNIVTGISVSKWKYVYLN